MSSFNHYCKIFRSNAFGRANSTIPMYVFFLVMNNGYGLTIKSRVNMLDDHDLIGRVVYIN